MKNNPTTLIERVSQIAKDIEALKLDIVLGSRGPKSTGKDKNALYSDAEIIKEVRKIRRARWK